MQSDVMISYYYYTLTFHLFLIISCVLSLYVYLFNVWCMFNNVGTFNL